MQRTFKRESVEMLMLVALVTKRIRCAYFSSLLTISLLPPAKAIRENPLPIREIFFRYVYLEEGMLGYLVDRKIGIKIKLKKLMCLLEREEMRGKK